MAKNMKIKQKEIRTDGPIGFMSQKQSRQAWETYLNLKQDKYAGEAMDYNTWRNEMEEYLNSHAKTEYQSGPIHFSNNDIHKANRRMALRKAWTDKQEAVLEKSYDKAVAIEKEIAEAAKDGDTEKVKVLSEDENYQMWRDFRKANPNFTRTGIRANQGKIYGYLKDYSGNWNEYFNS